MKIFSGFIGLVLLALALSFALANRQTATVSLWPFGVEIAAPLYLLTLGTLFTGILIGAVIGWFAMLNHRFEARRLRKDILMLHKKISELQQTVIPPARNDGHLLPPAKKPFWKLRA